MNSCKNISIEQAAQILDISPQMLRIGLQRKAFPFGTAIKGTGKQYKYYINSVALEKYVRGDMR